MLSWLYELLMSFVTMILGFFGVDMKKKSVTFADEGEKADSSESTSAHEEAPSTTPSE